MIKQELGNTRGLDFICGIPAIVSICGGVEHPLFSMSCGNGFSSRITFSFDNIEGRSIIKVRDRLNGCMDRADVKMDIQLPGGLLNAIKVNAISSDVTFENINADELRLKNVRGRLNIGNTSRFGDINLKLVSVDSMITLCPGQKSVIIDTVDCHTIIDAACFQGGIEGRAVGGQVKMDSMIFKNGYELRNNMAGNCNRIFFQVVGGELEINNYKREVHHEG